MKSPVATPMLSRALDLCSNFPLESLLRVNEFSGSPPLTVMVIVCPRRIFKERREGGVGGLTCV